MNGLLVGEKEVKWQTPITYTGTVANPSPVTFYPTFNESVSFVSVCFTDLRAVTGYWWDCCTAAIRGYLDVSLFFLFNTDIITVVQYFFGPPSVSQSASILCALHLCALLLPHPHPTLVPQRATQAFIFISEMTA